MKNISKLTAILLAITFFGATECLSGLDQKQFEVVNKPVTTLTPPTKPESDKAYNRLPNKAIIALKSLDNKGYVYAAYKAGKQMIKTLKSSSENLVSFEKYTPQETHFIVIKRNGCIFLRSTFMEGKCLACDPDSYNISFKAYDVNDTSQQWEINSGKGLDQVCFKNKGIQEPYVISTESGQSSAESSDSDGIPDVSQGMSCISNKTLAKSEFFRIVILCDDTLTL